MSVTFDCNDCMFNKFECNITGRCFMREELESFSGECPGEGNCSFCHPDLDCSDICPLMF